MFGVNLKNTRYMQYVAAIAATLSISAGSAYVTWPSPTKSALKGDDSPIGESLPDSQVSWIVSIYNLSGVIITPVSSFLIDKFGRRVALLVSGALYLFPWILIIFAKNGWMLFAARFIAGFGYAMSIAAVAIYNGEIADKDIRGKLSSFFVVMKLLGNVIVLTIGPFVSYLTLALICAAMPAIFMAVFFFMPESPYFYVKAGNTEDAKKELKRLSPDNIDEKHLDEKLQEIETNIAKDKENKVSPLDFFTRKEFRRVIIIMLGVKTMQQMSGTMAIDSSLQPIIEATGSSLSPEVSSIIFGIAQFPGAFACSYLIDRLGRKPILLISTTVCAVSLAAEGAYFYLQDHQLKDVSNLAWLPTTAMTFFLVFSTFGILNLPYIFIGELFSSGVKSTAASSATAYGALLSWGVSYSYDGLVDAWGAYTVFWIYSGFCVAGAIFTIFMIPETKGKTFDEIQVILGNAPKPTKEIEETKTN